MFLLADAIWKLREPDKTAAAALRGAGYSRVMSSLLALRGITAKNDAEGFIACDGSFGDPMLFKDMPVAAKRIKEGIDSHEKITVYGDYDCDGMTSTALLYSYLLEAGANVSYYIPDRETEGYGLNAESAQKIAADGTTLVITVDTGIAAFDEAGYFSKNGVTFIITDHHNPRDIIPEAFAVVDPKQPLCPYPFKELAGVGVAFKLISAIETLRTDALSERALFKKYGELVTIGTVADVVPLVSENRYIVSRGLKNITASPSLGLSALLDAAGVHGSRLSSTLLAFTVAPRINACGRVGKVDDALNLLLAKDSETAAPLAFAMNDNNKYRQDIETKICEEAIEKIDNNEALRNNPIMIVSGSDWHTGVIGIVASRLVDRYKKPAIVVSFDGDSGRASCRSIEGFNIHKALMSCSELLERFGGHEMAAGFTVKRENYDKLYSSLNRIANTLPEPPTQKITPDYRLRGKEVSLSTAREIKKLEPFGNGNPEPIFYVSSAQITGLSPVGNGHMRITLRCDGFEIRAIMFGAERNGFDFKTGDIVDFTSTLDIGLYKNNETLNIIIKNIRKSQCFAYYKDLYGSFSRGEPIKPPTLRLRLKPSRPELAGVYRALASGGGDVSLEEVCKSVFSKNINFNYFKLLVAVDAFAETGLLNYKKIPDTDRITYELCGSKKADIAKATLMQRLR